MTGDRKRRILDVGQCNFDHGNISRMLKNHYDVDVDRAASIDQVFYMASFYEYDLVLVNREFDADGTLGLDLIQQLKSNPETRDLPVMLVSNFADAQAEAAAAGAVPGFGKQQLDDPGCAELVGPYLTG